SVGAVEKIRLLPDNTVDVILAIKPHVGGQAVRIPSESKFLIQAPLTGDPSLLIVPPKPEAGEQPEILAPGVLPLSEQPEGTNTATIADLVIEGQGQMKALNAVMADVARREPKLLDELQQTLNNTNALTATASDAVAHLAAQSSAIATALQGNLAIASNHVVALTASLDRTVQGSSGRLTSTLAQIQATSTELHSTMDVVAGIATDPSFKGNVTSTTANIAQASAKLAKIASDLESITGDSKTKSQLRDTIRNIDETSQRANSLLGALGGKRTRGPSDGAPAGHATTGHHLPSLLSAQVRFSGYSVQHVGGGSPLLTGSRGPASSIGVTVLPHAKTQLFLGANDLGSGASSVDVVAVRRFARGVYVGGGIIYSRVGVLARVERGTLGFSSKLYDAARPMLDFSSNVRIAPGVKFFFGERDILHAQRRNVYGIEFTGAPR
ncbi:MAG TPA: hypothetical protein VMV73_05950, partial [Candidatus Dormibacteraeota bacterium]|nr:hypothetical protein [Candidatus Dormibacteraeota bacterium]